MIRQDFDVGDLVKFFLSSLQTESVGVVTASKLINKNTVAQLERQKWHPDEYHCKVKLTDGETRWIRAKWLRIVSKAEDNS